MKYITYNFTFKNGINQLYTLEIEPHEVVEFRSGLKEVNAAICNSMMNDTSGIIRLQSTDGWVHIRLSELTSAVVDGMDDLY